ncbi:hypothetical protein BUE80_DR013736 [Diplocarpon rosae]|nr:hypothetical protein BUE80_DR013736 [Diplocarpon rosae]
MRSAYFTIALLYSLTAGAFAQCTRQKVPCDSPEGCQHGIDTFKCPEGTTRSIICDLLYFADNPSTSYFDCGCCANPTQ